MPKRMKLNRLVAGPSVKQIYGTVLSGTDPLDISVEVRKDIFVAGQRGNLLSPSIPLTADSALYNVGFFDREYSVKNPDYIDDGVDLKVLPTDSDIMDVIQFGDYAFNLTNETTLGTKYDLTTTPTPGNAWYVSDDEYYLQKHEVAIYPTTGEISGQLPDGSNELSGVATTIKNISFNLTPETPDIVYGTLSGSTLVLYVKDQTSFSDTVYSLTGGIQDSLPFAYLMEQPLMYDINFGTDGFVYGGVSGDPVTGDVFLYTPLISGSADQDLYSPYADQEDDYNIYYNPFKLKNMYNYNWNCEYDRGREEMTGARDYLKVGKSQEHLWLSYKYYREYQTSVQEFELIERVSGLYKYKPIEGHKSNIYSIRIFNSGLNEDLNENTTELEIQSNLRSIIEETVSNAVKKIAPASTQLWKIEWSGR